MRSYLLALAISCAFWLLIERAAAGALAFTGIFVGDHGSPVGAVVILPCLLLVGAASIGFVACRSASWAVTDRHEGGDLPTRS